MKLHPTRRATLLGLAASLIGGRIPLAFAAAPGEKRLVVVLLRGALDGLAAVPPYGDGALRGLRGPLVPPEPGRAGGAFDLGGFWGLHPALVHLHAMYAAGEFLPVHAIAGPYRTRSHFEGQDLLQLGAGEGVTSGWLNRLLGVLPARAQGAAAEGEGLAVGLAVPLLLRGPARVGSFSPQVFAAPSADLHARLAALLAPDAVLGPAFAEGERERRFDATALRGAAPRGRAAYAFGGVAAAAGRILAAPGGPRIAAMQLEGWDTHAAQVERLHGPLSRLDAGLGALKSGLGEAWRHTAVLVMTEFGRTVRVNGTGGTDHGTATAAFLLGGAVAGGTVRADWPGLTPSRLFQNRDLAPTADVRSLAKGVLAEHFGLGAGALARVFPGSEAAAPMRGVIRS